MNEFALSVTVGSVIPGLERNLLYIAGVGTQKMSCKVCSSEWHSKWQCPHVERKWPFNKRSKPMRKEAARTRQKRLVTTAEWDAANPPNSDGHWYCYISKHPLCPKVLTKETLVREHDKSKARSPGTKYDIRGIYPSCTFDNEAKGSMSAEEYMSS